MKELTQKVRESWESFLDRRRWFRKGFIRRILHHFEVSYKPYSGPLTYHRDSSVDYYTHAGVGDSMSVTHGNICKLVTQAENIIEKFGYVEIFQRDGRHKTLIDLAKALDAKGYMIGEGQWNSADNGTQWLENIYVDKEEATFDNPHGVGLTISHCPLTEFVYKKPERD